MPSYWQLEIGHGRKLGNTTNHGFHIRYCWTSRLKKVVENVLIMQMEFKSILVHGHCSVSSMTTFWKYCHIRKYVCGGMNSTTEPSPNSWAEAGLWRAGASPSTAHSFPSWPSGLLPFLPPLGAAQGSFSIENLVPLSLQPILVIPTISSDNLYSFFWTPTFQSAGWPSAFVHPPHSCYRPSHDRQSLRPWQREGSREVWELPPTASPCSLASPYDTAGWHLSVLKHCSAGAHSSEGRDCTL